MGFYFELLKNFTEHLRIDLEIIKENDLENAYSLLKSGDADVLAFGLTVSSSKKRTFALLIRYLRQGRFSFRRNRLNWRSMTMDMLNKSL